MSKEVMIISCNMEIQHFNFAKSFIEKFNNDFDIYLIFQSHLGNQNIYTKLKVFIKRNGFIELLKRIVCRNIFSKIFLNEQKKIYEKNYEKVDLNYFYNSLSKEKVIITNDINQINIENLIKKIKPTFFLLQGGKLLKDNILNALSKTFKLHLHMGLVPYYRGGNSQFWSIYNNKINENGFTIQSVDLGIDTGSIYIRKSIIDFNEDDNQHTMFIKTHKNGIKAIIDLVSYYQKSKQLPSPISVKDKGTNYSGKMMNLCAFEYVYKNRARIFENYTNKNIVYEDLSVI